MGRRVRIKLLEDSGTKLPTPEIWNDSNVYVIGAGFSRPGGLPLVSDFMYQMRDALDSFADSSPAAARAISQVLTYRLNASSSAYRVRVDLENIEELFSLISAGNKQLDDAMRLAIASTIWRAQKRSSSCIATFQSSPTPSFQSPSHWQRSPPPNNYWEVPGYEFLAKALLGDWNGEERNNTFITFNYDQLLETALHGIGCRFTYGATGLDDTRRADDDALIQVLKLHGSINWAVADGSRLSAFGSFEEVVDRGLVPQLIPPTWRKDSLAAFGSIWDEAITAISRATRLVIVGFSIPPTDQHFRYLLAAGLSSNISLREIVFVSPDAADLERKARALFANHEHNAARLRFSSTGIEQFCNQGTVSAVHSIGRGLPPEIQHVNFRCVSA